MSDDDSDGDKPPKRRSKSKNRPYDVGKGKPPIATRFKKGGPSPNPAGRPKGARNKSNFEKECDKLITIGRDDRGRAIRRRLGDVIDRQLIKLVKELELRYATLRFRESPDAETIRRTIAEKEERQSLVKRIGRHLDHLAQLKKGDYALYKPSVAR